MEILPLPVGVEAAAVEALPLVGLPGALREVEIIPVALRLVGLHAWSPHLSHEQPRRRQRRVADHLRLDAEPVLPAEEPVLGITLDRGPRRGAAALIGATGDDLPEDRAEVPGGT